MNQDLLNVALNAAKIDKVSVIPVGKNKIPLISWREFQTRIATEDEIKKWFVSFPDMQLGFVTGKISNLSVVDVEKDGDFSFLPQDTFIVETGGGGRHYYYRYEEGLMNKARVKELVDVRSEGGYVMAPGSISEKGRYSVLKKMTPAKFPSHLFLKENYHSSNYHPPQVQPSNMTVSFLDFPGYGEGQRNDQMARYIGKVLIRVHPSEWETVAWPLIEAANLKNLPPLGQRELRTTFESIKDAEVRNSPFRWLKNDSRGNLPPSSVGFEQPQVLEEPGDEVKHLADVADEQKINVTDIYPLQMPIFDDVILGGVSPGDLVVISAQTGQGKTRLCQDWTVSLVRGSKKTKVLWFSYEVLISELWRKFQEMGLTREDLVFSPAKHSTGNLDWVEKKIKEAKEKFEVKAVVIDHLGFLMPKVKKGTPEKSLASNYATYLTQIVRDIKSIALQEEIIIFLPVHMRKAEHRSSGVDLEDIRDTSGVGQEADLVFLIERERNRDKDADSYFTDLTKIFLAKNRKTGITKIGRFHMVNGRFAQDTTDKEFKMLGETAPVKKEEKKEEVVQREIPIPYYNKDVLKEDDEITTADMEKAWNNL